MLLIDKLRSRRAKNTFFKRVESWANTFPVDSAERCRIVSDYLMLFDRSGLTMDEYYEFEFHKQTDEFRKTFLGLNEQRFYLDTLNPVKWYSFARNKYVAHKLLEDSGIRTAELYCYYEPHGVFDNSSSVASNVADVSRLLRTKGVTQCVIKSTEDSHGDNVVVVESIEYYNQDCSLLYFNGEKHLLSEVLGPQPRIFESLIRQTSQFNSFNRSSVNTVRFMTTLYPNGESRIIATFIKIGRAGKCVDNAGGGGNVDVCVDVESGEIKYAIQYEGMHSITDIDQHPDTGTQLNGVVIEDWEKIKSEVIKFQQAFPWCKAAGWDIAITDDGPVVVEVNDMWDRTGQLFIRRGWRNEIRHCYNAWAKYPSYHWIVGRQRNELKLEHLHKIICRNE